MQGRFIALCTLLVAIALACESDEWFIRVEKKTKNWASEESYKILHNNALLVTSEEFTNNAFRIFTHCIKKTSDGIYTLRMEDSANDAWSPGAYIRIRGPDYQVLYSGTMTERETEDHQFSLIYLIQDTDTWKVRDSNTPPSSWINYSFDDSDWDTYVGRNDANYIGTVYLRKTFTGASNMAAYEFDFYQQYGLIIYVNGKEVYRDYMPEGPVTADTACTGHYDWMTHRNFIRNGLEIEDNQGVIALEYHYDNNYSNHDFELNSFLAPYVATVGDSCYQSGESFSVTSSADDQNNANYPPENVFDLDTSSYWEEDSNHQWIDVAWSRWIPQINGLAIHTNNNRHYAPSHFKVYGYPKTESSQGDLLMDKQFTDYNNQWNYFNLVLNDKIYQRMRFQTLETETSPDKFRLYEIAYLTCRYSVPTKLELTESEVEVIANVDSIHIRPKYEGFVKCSISPSLPAGLSLKSNTCEIVGIPSEQVEAKVYTISTSDPFDTSATLTLTVKACDKTVIEITRIYGYNAIYETHWLRSAADESKTVERVLQNSNQKPKTTVKTRYCVEPGRYKLTLGHVSSTRWSADSYINIGIVDDTEVIKVLHWRFDLGTNYAPSLIINLGPVIARNSEWSYVMGEAPEDWAEKSIPEGWEKGKRDNFPDSTNQLQLYKKQFTLNDDPESGAGFDMEIRYQYGCIVAINGKEVFRHNVPEGPATNETYATDDYKSLAYRRITLPNSIAAEEGTTTYITKGENTVAVLLIGRTAMQDKADFDFSLRVMTQNEGRVFDFVTTVSDATEAKDSIFDLNSFSVYKSTACGDDRYIQIQFNNDRREWISKYSFINSDGKDQLASPYSWKVEAKNMEDEEWTTLDEVTSSLWWGHGQIKNIWINNNKAYNQYRFHHIKAESKDDCTIHLSQIALFADSLIRETPELDYIGSTTGYLNVDFTDLVPNSEYYSKFTVSPTLPAFLKLDYITGIIRGSEVSLLPATTYTVTAKKPNGSEVTKEISLSVIECDKVMIELVVRSDSFPRESSWQLYKGDKVEGDPVTEKKELDGANRYEYKYFCLDKGVYTFKFSDTYGDGWAAPAGYKIQTYRGIVLAQGSVPRSKEKPSVVTATFSTQLEAGLSTAGWKMTQKKPGRKWKDISFNDEKWTDYTGGNIEAKYEETTVYFRRTINNPDMNLYPVLNGGIYFGAGIVVYFNGRVIYRLNMPDTWDEDTLATAEHPTYTLEKYSIPLQIRGGVTGKNVIAIELHRAEKMSADTINFDGYALLALGECALMKWSPETVTATSPLQGSSEYGLMDGSPFYYTSWDWARGTYFQLSFTNQEGIIFNQYRLYSNGYHGISSWTVYSKKQNKEVFTLFDQAKGIELPDRSYYEKKVANGLLPYHDYRFEFDSVQYPTGFTISEIELRYCRYSGNSCPGINEYPMTGEGELSVAECPEFYEGYAYRECRGGVLQDVNLSRCKKSAPKNMKYDKPQYEIYVGAEVDGLKPSVYGLIDDYQVRPDLPEGLHLNPTTGAVEGVPTKVTTRLVTYTVTGYNEMGSTSASFQLKIVLGQCKADGDMFKPTNVGTTFVYECSEKKGYFGTITRSCKMGKHEPEWGPVIGLCMSKTAFIALAILLVIVALIVIVAVVKVMSDKKKARARTGVRGGKKTRNIMKSVPYSKI